MAGTQSNSIARVYDSLSGRNRIINGNCNVAQRGSVALTTGVSSYGGPDRFVAQNISAGGQFTQSQGTITFGGLTKNAVLQTVNTALTSLTTTNYWGGIQQRIEGYNCFDMLGQPISISFIFNTNVTGTYSLALGDGTGSNSYVTTFTATANTPAKYTFNIPTLPTTLGVSNTSSVGLFVTIGALNQGTYQTSTLNSWQASNFITSTSSTNWGSTINNFISVTEVQLEEGNIATPFEREVYGITFSKCQRYFQAYSFASGQAFLAGLNTSTTDAYVFFPLEVPMRIAGTATSVGAGAFNFNTGLGTIGLNSLTTTIFQVILHFSTPSGLTAYQAGYAVAASGTAVLFVNSEL
jgi:hypothetical protein